uniref:Aquaporin 10 n=1 Tax=Gallus gallus TaxID=9031 RepID=A0A8V1AAU2_CHICK
MGRGCCVGAERGAGRSRVPVLQLITLGGAAQMVTSSGTKGNVITSSLAGALAVMVAIYTAGGVSGAHLNPAFSLAMSLLGQLPWWKFPIFVAVQIFGSFIAAAAVYALYYGTQSPRWGRGWARSRGGSAAARLCPADAIWSYSNGTLTASGPRETASIFATYPAEHLSLPNGFLDQVLGTAVLITGILAITDTRNHAVPRGLEPVAVALLVLAIEVSMGSNCGCPMNPARDLGPRLFTLLAGWGTEVFRWVRAVGPGGKVGGHRLDAPHPRLRWQQGQRVVVGAGGGPAGGGRAGHGALSALRGLPPPRGGGGGGRRPSTQADQALTAPRRPRRG